MNNLVLIAPLDTVQTISLRQWNLLNHDAVWNVSDHTTEENFRAIITVSSLFLCNWKKSLVHMSAFKVKVNVKNLFSSNATEYMTYIKHN